MSPGPQQRELDGVVPDARDEQPIPLGGRRFARDTTPDDTRADADFLAEVWSSPAFVDI